MGKLAYVERRQVHFVYIELEVPMNPQGGDIKMRVLNIFV